MANISFKRGSNLNNLAITDGQFIVNTTERSIYVDVGTERLRIGDFVSVANIDALPAVGGHATALYYVEDINCLAKWDGSSWIQINRDTGVKEVKVEGDGNAITAASYDATTRILTLTKGETFATPAVVDGKISTKVGTIEGTVKDYVDAKTSGIASDAALTALGERVTTAEGEIDALQTAIADGGSVANAIADAKKAGTDAATAAAAAQATADSKTTMAAVEAKNYATKTEAQGYANAKDAAISAAKSAADAAQADVDALEAKVGTVPEKKTVVEMISDAQAAATYDDTALKGRVSNIEKDYLKAADKTALSNTISGIDTAYKAADTALSNRVKAIEDDHLKKADKTELANSIADVKSDVDTFLASANIGGEAIDTLKEIQDYISSDGTAAAEMTNKIGALETTVGKAAEGENPATGLVKSVADNASAIATEKSRAESKEAELVAADATNLQAAKDYADDAVEALNISQYATKADLDTHTGNTTVHITADERSKWNAAAGKAHTHSNKALLDTYTQTEADLADAVAKKHEHANAEELAKIEAGDKAKWDTVVTDHLVAADKTELEGKITAAETAAKNHADGLNTTMNARVEALEAIDHDHNNKTVLDDITSEKVSAWDSAEQNAKNYSDAKLIEALQWGTF